MSSLDLAMIGNCAIAALLDSRARLVWCCLPRFDSDPTFCALVNDGVDEHGVFEIELIDLDHTEQSYRRNSAVLVTRLYDRHGGAVEITDFVPRFKRFGRLFRPTEIMRHLRPLSGTPRIRIKLRPSYDFGQQRAAHVGPGRIERQVVIDRH